MTKTCTIKKAQKQRRTHTRTKKRTHKDDKTHTHKRTTRHALHESVGGVDLHFGVLLSQHLDESVGAHALNRLLLALQHLTEAICVALLLIYFL